MHIICKCCKITRVKDYKGKRLQNYKITRLQDYKIARLQILRDYKYYKITIVWLQILQSSQDYKDNIQIWKIESISQRSKGFSEPNHNILCNKGVTAQLHALKLTHIAALHTIFYAIIWLA